MRLARRLTIGAVLGALAILALPGVAAAKDGNHDRIPDRWEKRHHLSTSVNQARRDQDHDQLGNRGEFLAGDNPRDRDSDNDGVIDGDENAGTIQSFDTATGRLVISLFGGEEISGLVTDQTRIKCENEHAPDVSMQSHQGEEEPGDDHGGHGEEPDDDNGDHSGPGSPNSGPGSGEDDEGEARCSTADLVAGTVVQEAELKAANGTATFEEVELLSS